MGISCNALLDYLRTLNPKRKLGREEGVIYGSEECTTEGILVAWMPTVAAIRRAKDESCQVILSHEALTFHDYFAQTYDENPWTADKARLALLDQAAITVVRVHSTADPTYVVAGFIQAIGLSAAIQQGDIWSYHEEEPVSVRHMARKVAPGLGMGLVRVTGDPDRVVTRIGTMVGGLGLDRHLDRWEHDLVGLGVELIIAGETNDFAQRFAIDSGLALIETCHSASEEPGLKMLSDDVQARFPETKVVFHKEAVPWELI